MRKLIYILPLLILIACSSSKNEVDPEKESFDTNAFINDGGIYGLTLPNKFIPEYDFHKSQLRLFLTYHNQKIVKLSILHFDQKGSLMATTRTDDIPFDEIQKANNEIKIEYEVFTQLNDTYIPYSLIISKSNGKLTAKYKIDDKEHKGELELLTPLLD